MEAIYLTWIVAFVVGLVTALLIAIERPVAAIFGAHVFFLIYFSALHYAGAL